MSLNLSCIFEIRVWVAVLAMASISVFLGCSGVDSSTKRQLSTAQKHASPTFCDANLQTPGDISLRVSLKSGQTVFPEGEIIILTTSYSAQTRKKYSVWGGSEVGLPFFGNGEVYCLSPDIGLTDNLLEGAIWPGIAGGGSTSLGMGDPGMKPLVSDLELNKPRTFIPSGRSIPAGKYRLRVISQRVTPAVKDIFQRPAKERIAVVSNTVQFEVHADPEWQARQFAEEKKTLNSRSAAPWQKLEAIHKLRFLDTESSVRELVEHFDSLVDSSGQPGQWEILYALFGTRHRATAIEEMRAVLQNRHRSIDPDFAKLLAALEMQADPRFRVPRPDQMKADSLAKKTEADKVEFDRRVREYLELAAAIQPGRAPKGP
jgi:hypothetical protein